MQTVCSALCCAQKGNSGFNEEITVVDGLEKANFGPCHKSQREEFFHEGLSEAGSSVRGSRRTYVPEDTSEASSVRGLSEESSVRGRRKNLPLEEKPRQVVEEGACYTGQWRGNVRHGHGKIERRRIGTYEGQFVDNRATGEGRFVKLNGDVYEGQWLRDRAHGKGTYLHADGSSYQGQWEEDLKSGMGVETWLDGSTFEGEYMQGKKHGRGTYRSADHSVFEGQFFLDAMDGDGQYVFADGRIYIGQWQQSRMSGEGRMIWPDVDALRANTKMTSVLGLENSHGLMVVRTTASGTRANSMDADATPMLVGGLGLAIGQMAKR